MDFKAKLSQRIGMDGIVEILRLTRNSDTRKQELYALVFSCTDTIAYQAAWVLTHLSPSDNKWLLEKQDELIDEVLVCEHGGKRRVILNLLYKQSFPNPPRVDFLDFCLERMMSAQELPGVKSLCMKIAYELCMPIPELVQELKTILEMMEPNQAPSMQAVRKNVLKAIKKGKSLYPHNPV